MNIPFTAVYFSTYESAKKALGAREAWQEETLRVQLLAGGLAGGTAAGLTTPLDVVKTRLQLAGVSSPIATAAARWCARCACVPCACAPSPGALTPRLPWDRCAAAHHAPHHEGGRHAGAVERRAAARAVPHARCGAVLGHV